MRRCFTVFIELQFKMPVDKHPIRLQKSENQERPAMLQLSEELCADTEVIVLEHKPTGGQYIYVYKS